MLRRLLPLVLVLTAMVGFTPAAHAKGPTAAIVEGPGLAGPARLELGEPVPDKPDLMALLSQTGGDRLIFSNDAELTEQRPAGDLGDRYLVTFLMGDQPALRQEVYPFAEHGPVTYTTPGQRSIFIDSTIASGWFDAPDALRTQLVRMGVPEPVTGPSPTSGNAGAAPAAVGGSEANTGGWLAVVALVGLVVVSGGLLVARRLSGAGQPAGQ